MDSKLIPLNFAILADPRNWLLVLFVLFLIGTLVHYLAPPVANSN